MPPPATRAFAWPLLPILLGACADSTGPGPDPDPTPAQPALYEDVTPTHLPSAPNGFTMDIGVGDFDGDGDVDAVLAIEFGQNRLLLNDGEGRFRDASDRLPAASHDSEDIAVADFDGDGDLDLVVVSEDDRTNEYYVNDGQARFSASSLPVSGTSNAVVAGDIDDDGDLDLVIGNAGPEFVLVNDGSGNWSSESDVRIPPEATGITQDVELGDVDLDGDLDLLVGNEDGNRLLLNDGTGVFEDATDVWIPTRPTAEETREADLGDVDGDGDLDAFFANTASSFPNANPGNRLLLNEGDRFSDVSATHLPPNSDRSFDGEFWDVDGDGDLDIVSGVLPAFGQSPPPRFVVWVNDGAGLFAPPDTLVFPSTAVGFGFDTEMVDVDGDGVLDFFLGSRGTQDRLLLRR